MDVIQSLWIGGRLSTLEQLSLTSFLACGHPVHLYAYAPIGGVPEGVELKDANEILPAAEIYRMGPAAGQRQGSYAAFADLFRYKLLFERGGWWVDTDIVCLRPFTFSAEICFGYQEPGVVNNAVIKAPAGCALMEAVYREVRRLGPGVSWEQIGPHPFTQVLQAEGALERYAEPEITFYPVRWPDHRQLFAADQQLPAESAAVHFWRTLLLEDRLDLEAAFPESSIFETLKRRYRIGQAPAAHTLPINECIARYAAWKKNVEFVQIGAYDGAYLDLLHPFVRGGDWRGLLVEPFPAAFERLQQTYADQPGLRFEHCAVTAHDGAALLYYLDIPRAQRDRYPEWMPAVMSLKCEHVLAHLNEYPELVDCLKQLSVPALSLRTLLAKHGLPAVNFFACDAEGLDAAIVLQLDLKTAPPEMVLFEHRHLDARALAAVDRVLQQSGYELLRDGENTLAVGIEVSRQLQQLPDDSRPQAEPSSAEEARAHISVHDEPRLGIAVDHYWGREQYTRSAISWCKQRQIRYELLPLSAEPPYAFQANACDWDRINALYLPLRYNFTLLDQVPPQIPIITEFDNFEASPELNAQCRKRRIAARRVYLGRAEAPDLQFQVPLSDLPPALPPAQERDLVLVDIHAWSNPQYMFFLAALFAKFDQVYHQLCERAGVQLKFYLNCCMPFDLFRELAESYRRWCQGRYAASWPSLKWYWEHSPVGNIEANLIPTVMEHDAHRALYGRARLYVSEVLDLVNPDLFSAVMTGTPIMFYTTQFQYDAPHIRYCLRKAAERIESTVAAEYDKVETLPLHSLHAPFDFLAARPGGGLRPEPFVNLYYKTFDLLWHWACTGQRDAEVHRLCVAGSPEGHLQG